MPGLLQLALSGREFSDTVIFTHSPRLLQRLVFAVLAPLARQRGLRGSYPELKDAVARIRISRSRHRCCADAPMPCDQRGGMMANTRRADSPCLGSEEVQQWLRM